MRPPPSLLACSLPRASCSYSVSRASTPLLSLPGRSLHVSSISFETDVKRDKRITKKKLKTMKVEKLEDWFNTQPDPFLGMQLVYANGIPVHEQRWRQTKLAATIIDPNTLWTTGINAPKNVFSTLSNAPTTPSKSESDEFTYLPSPSNPSSTKIVTSRLSLEEQIEAATSPAQRELLTEEERILDEEDELRELETELKEKEEELAALETLRSEAQEIERIEVLRDQVMAAAVKLGVVTEEEVSRDHPIVVAELDRIVQFAPREEFPEAVWKPTEDGEAGHWLRAATSVPPLEFPTEEATTSTPSPSSSTSEPTTTPPSSTTTDSTPSSTSSSSEPDQSIAAAIAAQKLAQAAKAKSEASSSHRPIVDSSLLAPAVILAEPAPDYSRSPLVTLFSPNNAIDSFPVPTFIGHLLTETDKRFIFNTLPHVTAQKDIMPLPGIKLSREDMQRRVERAEEAMEGERRSLEALGRILNLKNADAKLIAKENRRRVVEAFGQPEVKSLKEATARVRKGPDCGSPEVQAALLTLKIRNLRSHLMLHMQDKKGDYEIRQLAHDRKRVLEYLKTVDRVRYDKCLMEIGVDKRAVEGELIIHKWWRQVIPKGRYSKTTKFVGKASKHGALVGSKKLNPRNMGDQGLTSHY